MRAFDLIDYQQNSSNNLLKEETSAELVKKLHYSSQWNFGEEGVGEIILLVLIQFLQTGF